MTKHIKITLKPKKEESILRFHPWIFSGAIAKMERQPQEGEIVDIYSANNDFCGTGHFQLGSIAVRVLSFSQTDFNQDFWTKKIQASYDMRCAIGLANSSSTNSYRLVHGEGDSLPGLIIDIYDKTAVMQAHSIGMHLAHKEIAKALSNVYGDKIENIYYKSATTLPPYYVSQENIEDYYIKGKDDGKYLAKENDILFHADWIKGQKTGFFIDQRENRHLLEYYAKDKTMLNMFCYTGGFSLYAMRGGAKLVHSVDSSAKAIELTKDNVALNFKNDPRHDAFAEDAFKFLNEMETQYDLIVLDPPAFAKHRDAIRHALQGYKKINAKAFEKIKPGGILFTFSCSQAINKDQFRLAVFSAAAMSKRNVRILHQLTQPADHPIGIYHPEGEYLKGLVLYVE